MHQQAAMPTVTSNRLTFHLQPQYSTTQVHACHNAFRPCSTSHLGSAISSIDCRTLRFMRRQGRRLRPRWMEAHRST